MRKRIGDIFVEKRLLTQAQLEQVLEYSRANGVRFGDAAQKMGLVTPKAVERIFGASNRFDFFYLDVNFFPAVTKEIFAVPTILKNGVLPLGFKTEQKFFRTRKLLNLGLLTPNRQVDVLPELDRIAKEKMGENAFQDFKIYLILADQFLGVLSRHFDFTEAMVRNFEGELDEALVLHLEGGTGLLKG